MLGCGKPGQNIYQSECVDGYIYIYIYIYI
jgi:hypothetical protein